MNDGKSNWCRGMMIRNDWYKRVVGGGMGRFFRWRICVRSISPISPNGKSVRVSKLSIHISGMGVFLCTPLTIGSFGSCLIINWVSWSTCTVGTNQRFENLFPSRSEIEDYVWCEDWTNEKAWVRNIWGKKIVDYVTWTSPRPEFDIPTTSKLYLPRMHFVFLSFPKHPICYP